MDMSNGSRSYTFYFFVVYYGALECCGLQEHDCKGGLWQPVARSAASSYMASKMLSAGMEDDHLDDRFTYRLFDVAMHGLLTFLISEVLWPSLCGPVLLLAALLLVIAATDVAVSWWSSLRSRSRRQENGSVIGKRCRSFWSDLCRNMLGFDQTYLGYFLKIIAMAIWNFDIGGILTALCQHIRMACHLTIHAVTRICALPVNYTNCWIVKPLAGLCHNLLPRGATALKKIVVGLGRFLVLLLRSLTIDLVAVLVEIVLMVWNSMSVYYRANSGSANVNRVNAAVKCKGKWTDAVLTMRSNSAANDQTRIDHVEMNPADFEDVTQQFHASFAEEDQNSVARSSADSDTQQMTSSSAREKPASGNKKRRQQSIVRKTSKGSRKRR